VITNQQCVGKGLLNREALEALHQRMIDVLEGAGARIDRVYYCPHLANERCECRKPRPGLLYQAIQELGGTIDVAIRSFVGDTETDMIAGRAVGVQTILLGDSVGLRGASVANHVVGSLRDVEALF
jgi:histidinol-phosphate phosphatase family protein